MHDHLTSRQLTKWGLALLCVALGVYVLYLPFYYVGRYEDDAMYVLAAKSLCSGRFVSLPIPGHPPLKHILPGYSMFLAPFVKLIEPNWSGLRWVSLGMTIGVLYLAWLLYRRWLGLSVALGALVLLAFNPLFARQAPVVMSDYCFLFSILLVFWTLERALQADRLGRQIGLGIALGWCAIIRPPGALMIIAIAGGLIYGRRWKILRVSLGIAGVIASAVFARNYLLFQSATGYLGFWRGALRYLAEGHQFEYAMNAAYGCVRVMLPGLPLWPDGGTNLTAQTVIGLGGLAVMALGIREFERDRRQPAEVLFSATFFWFSSLILLALWTTSDTRYFLVLLPLSLLFAIRGLQKLLPEGSRKSLWHAGALTLMLAAYGLNHWRMLQGDRTEYVSESRMPSETLDWIARHTSKDDLFLGRQFLIYLYTGRQGYGESQAPDIEYFRYRLLLKKIRFLFFDKHRILSVRGTGRDFIDQRVLWERRQRWMAVWPSAFSATYTAPDGQTVLYEAIPDPAFLNAYSSWLATAQACSATNKRSCRNKLEEGLASYPTLASASNHYAELCLQSDGHCALAMKYLRLVLRRWPDHPPSLSNLGRLYLKRKEYRLARECLQQARQSLERWPEYNDWAPSIDSDMRTIPAG